LPSKLVELQSETYALEIYIKELGRSKKFVEDAVEHYRPHHIDDRDPAASRALGFLT